MKKSKIIVSLMLVVCLAFSCFATGCSESVNLDAYFKYNGLAILLPEGFTVSDMSGMKVACGPDYPTSSDNITFSYSETDDISKYSEDVVLATFKALDSTIEKLDTYEKIKINNVDFIHVKASITFSEISMTQTGYYATIGGKVVGVTFTSTSGKYDADFETTAQSMRAV